MTDEPLPAEQEPMPLCPNCGTDTVGTYVADNSFKYGVENPITLIAKDVLYFHCTECHLDFTGEDGEYKRTSAVITHLATRIESLTARLTALEAEHALDQAALEAAEAVTIPWKAAPATMANCETDGHIYRSMSTKCIFCGFEPKDWEKCATACAEYKTGLCRCAQLERMPSQTKGDVRP